MSVTARRLDDLEQEVNRAESIVARQWDERRHLQELQRWIDTGRLWCDADGWHARAGDVQAGLLVGLLEDGRKRAAQAVQILHEAEPGQ